MPNIELTHLNIATRQSPLALWQAEHIKARLETLYPNLKVELVTMVTRGDKILDTPLAKIGGKGLFVKELEQALYEGRADIAVHSLKDVPMDLPDGLMLGAYCEREAPTDAFISNQFEHLDDLPQGAVVGTASLRRQAQLLSYRPDLHIKTLRGNLGTRLGKLDATNNDDSYDAIILATSGLTRMGLEARIKHELDIEVSLPAVGQGALAIECRGDDEAVLNLLAPLNDADARLRLLAERAFNRHLQGGCQVPIAGFAVLEDQADDRKLWLRGRVGSVDGKTLLKADKRILLVGNSEVDERHANDLGIAVADELMQLGAGKILAEIYRKA